MSFFIQSRASFLSTELDREELEQAWRKWFSMEIKMIRAAEEQLFLNKPLPSLIIEIINSVDISLYEFFRRFGRYASVRDKIIMTDSLRIGVDGSFLLLSDKIIINDRFRYDPARYKNILLHEGIHANAEGLPLRFFNEGFTMFIQCQLSCCALLNKYSEPVEDAHRYKAVYDLEQDFVFYLMRRIGERHVLNAFIKGEYSKGMQLIFTPEFWKVQVLLEIHCGENKNKLGRLLKIAIEDRLAEVGIPDGDSNSFYIASSPVCNKYTPFLLGKEDGSNFVFDEEILKNAPRIVLNESIAFGGMDPSDFLAAVILFKERQSVKQERYILENDFFMAMLIFGMHYGIYFRECQIIIGKDYLGIKRKDKSVIFNAGDISPPSAISIWNTYNTFLKTLLPPFLTPSSPVTKIDKRSLAKIFPHKDYLAELIMGLLPIHLWTAPKEVKDKVRGLYNENIYPKWLELKQIRSSKDNPFDNFSSDGIEKHYLQFLQIIKENEENVKGLLSLDMDEQIKERIKSGIRAVRAFGDGIEILLDETVKEIDINDTLSKMLNLIFSDYYRQRGWNYRITEKLSSNIPILIAAQDKIAYFLFALCPKPNALRLIVSSPLAQDPNLRILVVEDDSSIADIIRLRLENRFQDIEIILADAPNRAFKEFVNRYGEFILVITDLNLNTDISRENKLVGGLRLIAEIRTGEKSPNKEIPLILFTSHPINYVSDEEEEIRDYLNFFRQDSINSLGYIYVQKPDYELLMRKVEDIIIGQRKRDEASSPLRVKDSRDALLRGKIHSEAIKEVVGVFKYMVYEKTISSSAGNTKPAFNLKTPLSKLIPHKEISDVLRNRDLRVRFGVHKGYWLKDYLLFRLWFEPTGDELLCLHLKAADPSSLISGKNLKGPPLFVKESGNIAEILRFDVENFLSRGGIKEIWLKEYIEPYLVRCGFKAVAVYTDGLESRSSVKFWREQGFTKRLRINKGGIPGEVGRYLMFKKLDKMIVAHDFISSPAGEENRTVPISLQKNDCALIAELLKRAKYSRLSNFTSAQELLDLAYSSKGRREIISCFCLETNVAKELGRWFFEQKHTALLHDLLSEIDFAKRVRLVTAAVGDQLKIDGLYDVDLPISASEKEFAPFAQVIVRSGKAYPFAALTEKVMGINEDSLLLIDSVEANKDDVALEFGTGMGVGAALLAHKVDKVFASDINKISCAAAEFNIKTVQKIENAEVVHGDMFEPFRGRKFSLIVSHPPYLPFIDNKEIENPYELTGAFGGEKGRDIIDRILIESGDYLTEGGRVYIIHPDFVDTPRLDRNGKLLRLEETFRLMRKNGLEPFIVGMRPVVAKQEAVDYLRKALSKDLKQSNNIYHNVVVKGVKTSSPLSSPANKFENKEEKEKHYYILDVVLKPLREMLEIGGIFPHIRREIIFAISYQEQPEQIALAFINCFEKLVQNSLQGYEAGMILSDIAKYLDNISDINGVLARLSRFCATLCETSSLRKESEVRVTKQIEEAFANGEFEQSIFATAGNIFVVGEVYDRYILLTNSHVIKGHVEDGDIVMLKTSGNPKISKDVAVAKPILTHRHDWDKLGYDGAPIIGDIGILTVGKDELLGNVFRPIKIASHIEDGEFALKVCPHFGSVQEGWLFPVEAVKEFLRNEKYYVSNPAAKDHESKNTSDESASSPIAIFESRTLEDLAKTIRSFVKREAVELDFLPAGWKFPNPLISIRNKDEFLADIELRGPPLREYFVHPVVYSIIRNIELLKISLPKGTPRIVILNLFKQLVQIHQTIIYVHKRYLLPLGYVAEKVTDNRYDNSWMIDAPWLEVKKHISSPAMETRISEDAFCDIKTFAEKTNGSYSETAGAIFTNNQDVVSSPLFDNKLQDNSIGLLGRAASPIISIDKVIQQEDYRNLALQLISEIKEKVSWFSPYLIKKAILCSLGTQEYVPFVLIEIEAIARFFNKRKILIGKYIEEILKTALKVLQEEYKESEIIGFRKKDSSLIFPNQVLSEENRKFLLSDFEKEVKRSKQKGEFLRSIIRFQGKGSGFVADEINGFYIILTASHVVKMENWLKVRTSHQLFPRNIGMAQVVIKSEIATSESDIAMLVLEKKATKGVLYPIKTISEIEFDDGEPAVLASGYNRTVSAGFLMSTAHEIRLVGAKTRSGDSGSPYLIKTNVGYFAVGVHSRRYGFGTYFTYRLIESMLNTIEIGHYERYLLLAKETHIKEIVKEFLDKIRNSCEAACIKRIKTFSKAMPTNTAGSPMDNKKNRTAPNRTRELEKTPCLIFDRIINYAGDKKIMTITRNGKIELTAINQSKFVYWAQRLKSETGYGRAEAVLILRKLAKTEPRLKNKIVKLLINAKNDAVKEIRTEIARGLGEIGGLFAMKALIELLKDENEDVRVRADAELQKINHPLAEFYHRLFAGELLEFSGVTIKELDSGPEVRLTAVRGLIACLELIKEVCNVGPLSKLKGFHNGFAKPVTVNFNNLLRLEEIPTRYLALLTASDLHPGNRGIVYKAPQKDNKEEYLTYLWQIKDEERFFDELLKHMEDRALLAKRGWYDESPIPLFHNLADRTRGDLGKFWFLSNDPVGMLDEWRDAVKLCNLRLGYHADVGHFSYYSLILAMYAFELISTHLFSASLLLGAWYRIRNKEIDPIAYGRRLRKIFERYTVVYSGLPKDFVSGIINFFEVGIRCAEEMNNDEARYGTKDSPGSPDLGTANEAFPIPELIKAIYTFSLVCLIGKKIGHLIKAEAAASPVEEEKEMLMRAIRPEETGLIFYYGDIQKVKEVGLYPGEYLRTPEGRLIAIDAADVTILGLRKFKKFIANFSRPVYHNTNNENFDMISSSMSQLAQEYGEAVYEHREKNGKKIYILKTPKAMEKGDRWANAGGLRGGR